MSGCYLSEYGKRFFSLVICLTKVMTLTLSSVAYSSLSESLSSPLNKGENGMKWVYFPSSLTFVLYSTSSTLIFLKLKFPSRTWSAPYYILLNKLTGFSCSFELSVSCLWKPGKKSNKPISYLFRKAKPDLRHAFSIYRQFLTETMYLWLFLREIQLRKLAFKSIIKVLISYPKEETSRDKRLAINLDSS